MCADPGLGSWPAPRAITLASRAGQAGPGHVLQKSPLPADPNSPSLRAPALCPDNPEVGPLPGPEPCLNPHLHLPNSKPCIPQPSEPVTPHCCPSASPDRGSSSLPSPGQAPWPSHAQSPSSFLLGRAGTGQCPGHKLPFPAMCSRPPCATFSLDLLWLL